jgi:hypothetical protein
MSGLAAANQHDNGRKLTSVLLATGSILIVVGFVLGITDNPPGILCVLLGFFTFVFGCLHRAGKSRNLTPARRFLYWAPRSICLVFAAFISLFAMDVFGEGRGFWETAFALLMHLIPTLAIIGVLVVSWQREWIGGILFIVLGLSYVTWAWGRFPVATHLLIAGPLVVTGILFLLNWRYRAALKPPKVA